MTKSINFELGEVCTGKGIIYYTTKHLQKKRTTLLYCFMEEEDETFNLYRCSPDGEPSYPVSFNTPLAFMIPKGDSKLEKNFRKFLDSKGK